jgi:hypothetical protein
MTSDRCDKTDHDIPDACLLALLLSKPERSFIRGGGCIRWCNVKLDEIIGLETIHLGRQSFRMPLYYSKNKLAGRCK